MFVFGILAVLQIIFLPGMILVKLFKIRWHGLQVPLLVFGLSMVVNYALGLLLVAVGLYLRGVMLTIFVGEVAVLLYLYRDALTRPLAETAADWLAQGRGFIRSQAAGLVGGEDDRPLSRFFVGLVSLVVVVYALSMVWWGVKVWLNGVGMVIDQWDAVVTWNNWTRAWATNNVPVIFGQYPQLLPLNLSLPYVFMGSDSLQFFNTAVASMFTGAILLLLFDLALQHKRVGFFAAIIAGQFIIKKFTGNFMNTVYVDIPLTFFAFAAVYAAYQARRQADLDSARPYIWASALLAAGAASTKQPGLWMLAFVPLFLFFVALPEFSVTSWRERIRILWLPFAVAVLIALPWYVYVQLGIFSGRISPNMSVLTDKIYGDKTRLEIFLDAFRSLGVYGWVWLVVMVGSAWLEKAWRWMVFGVVLPYTLIWAALFSYEPRNLALAVGFWALAVGLVFEKLLLLGGAMLEKLRLGRLGGYVLPVCLVALLAVGGFVVTDENLTARHDEVQRTILDKKINDLIYAYFDELGTVEPVISSYPLNELPGLIGIRMSFRYADLFYRNLTEYPDVHYLLMPQTADPVLLDEILGKVESGEYEQLFFENRYYFINMQP